MPNLSEITPIDSIAICICYGGKPRSSIASSCLTAGWLWHMRVRSLPLDPLVRRLAGYDRVLRVWLDRRCHGRLSQQCQELDEVGWSQRRSSRMVAAAASTRSFPVPPVTGCEASPTPCRARRMPRQRLGELRNPERFVELQAQLAVAFGRILGGERTIAFSIACLWPTRSWAKTHGIPVTSYEIQGARERGRTPIGRCSRAQLGVDRIRFAYPPVCR